MSKTSNQQIRIFSDLHLEFDTNALKKCESICKNTPAKYVLLAGDVTNFTKREALADVSATLKPLTEHLIYVLGNHEFYGSEKGEHEDVKKEYRSLCESAGIVLLDDSSFETDDAVFYGTTLWSHPSTTAYAKMNDRRVFDFEYIIQIHEESVRLLEDFVSKYTSSKPLVVITHHLPSFTLIDEEYVAFRETNTGFASNSDHLIRPPIKLWAYGHTHKPRETAMNGVFLVSNPHGYPNERYNNDDYRDCFYALKTWN